MSQPAETTGKIGVFDSGVGGLTVIRALRQRYPAADLLYLGDTARVPYGTKSSQVVERYSRNCARFLVDQGADAVVIACNTASAFALETLQREFEVPVFGVVDPGARLAGAASKAQRIGVIATEGTITSGTYQRAIALYAPAAKVFARACPLFVPLAEEGMIDHPATELIAREYLAPLLAADIDTLVLGCTHYPLLVPVFRRVAPNLQLIDSATAVAAQLAPIDGSGTSRFFATDVSQRVLRVGSSFLGAEMPGVELVDLPIQN